MEVVCDNYKFTGQKACAKRLDHTSHYIKFSISLEQVRRNQLSLRQIKDTLKRHSTEFIKSYYSTCRNIPSTLPVLKLVAYVNKFGTYGLYAPIRRGG